MADEQRDTKGPRAPLNIPAGNSPITPDAQPYDPAEEKLTGDWWGDRMKALKVGRDLASCVARTVLAEGQVELAWLGLQKGKA